MSAIYKIIDKKKFDIVKRPISRAHGLPNECYTSKDYTLIEREKIFENKWTVIGVASSLPNIGDVKPFNLLGLPLFLVRNKKNQIKVSTDCTYCCQEKYHSFRRDGKNSGRMIGLIGGA